MTEREIVPLQTFLSYVFVILAGVICGFASGVHNVILSIFGYLMYPYSLFFHGRKGWFKSEYLIYCFFVWLLWGYVGISIGGAVSQYFDEKLKNQVLSCIKGEFSKDPLTSPSIFRNSINAISYSKYAF